jgi:hypothetical protein
VKSLQVLAEGDRLTRHATLLRLRERFHLRFQLDRLPDSHFGQLATDFFLHKSRSPRVNCSASSPARLRKPCASEYSPRACDRRAAAT